MKKGLLSILAASAVLVGCQNYDDQFDALNTQITSLKTQVEGLAGVQSDVNALKGLISSLQTTVDGVSNAALDMDDLQSVLDRVNTLEENLGDVATQDDLDGITEDLTDVQGDVTELLNNSNVFTGDLTINSVSSLNAALAYGTKINIVNGNVDITAKTDMDADSLQKVISRINTVVKGMTYEAESSSIKAMNFEALVGTATLTVKMGGDYLFPNLNSATNIVLKNEYKSKVKAIDFSNLTSVESFKTGSDNHTIDFSKAESVNLASLPYYKGSNLTIKTKKEATLTMTAFDDVDGDGDQKNINLTFDGPSPINFSNILDGTITLTDVKDATINGFEGDFVINNGVENFNADKVTGLTVAATNSIETINITGALNPDDSTDKEGPAISFESDSDVENATFAGTFASITMDDNGSLTDLTISADVTGEIVIKGNSDLVNLELVDSKATGVTVENNADITDVNIKTTMRKGVASGAKLDGKLIVKDNTSLISLSSSANNIETLTITGNDDLATLAFDGLSADGATGKPNVNIYDNDITASKFTDNTDGTTDKLNGAAGDEGSISGSNGMDTLEDYLDHVAGNAAATANVFFDTVETFVDEASAETSDIEYNGALALTAQNDKIKLLVKSPNTGAAQKTAKTEKLAFVVSGITAGDNIQIRLGGSKVFANGSGVAYDGSGETGLDLNANKTLDVAAITNSVHVARALAEDVVLTAAQGGLSTVNVTILAMSASSATLEGERYSTLAAYTSAAASATSLAGWLGSDDYVKLTVGSNSVTATSAAGTASGVVAAIVTAWDAKYGTAGTASASGLVSITNNSDGTMTLDGRSAGTAGHDISVNLEVYTGTSTATHARAVNYTIGATRATGDNKTDSENVIVMLSSNVDGILSPLYNKTDDVFSAKTGVTITQLTTTVLQNSDAASEATGYAATLEERADTRLPEAAVAAGANTQVNFSRVSWL